MIDDELRALVSVEPRHGWDANLSTRVAAGAAARQRAALRHFALAAAGVVVVSASAVLWWVSARDVRSLADAPPLEARAAALEAWPAFESAPAMDRPALPAPPAPPALPAPPAQRHLRVVQVDQREARALRELFSSASTLSLAVPEPRSGPIVVPEIAIEPIAASNIEGARQ
jgi:hypothetical protein